MAASKANLSEKQVVRLWRQLLGEASLATEDGLPLRVIYPGRLNDDRGADFRDAVIARNGEISQGDIEIHVRSSDWQLHGHHEDAACNTVILHVVMWPDSRRATLLQSGREAPVLALSRYLRTPVAEVPNLPTPAGPGPPCFQTVQSSGPEAIAGLLDESGAARFFQKSARFHTAISQDNPGQVLYEGIMEALGYTRNSAAFRELARRLPLKTLESFSQKEAGQSRLQALILSAAGLRHAPPSERSCLQIPQPVEPMSPEDWDLFKVRPQNSPIRRLEAMSRLLRRYRAAGLLQGLMAIIEEAPLSRGNRLLEKALVIGGPGNQGRKVTLLGPERAAIIIINVLLPFTYAFSQLAFCPDLAEKAFEQYRRYPKQVPNSLEKHMGRQLGLSGKLVDSARRQQGLIHLYKTLCTQGKCGECPLHKVIKRHNFKTAGELS